jgi:hypothetical protein
MDFSNNSFQCFHAQPSLGHRFASTSSDWAKLSMAIGHASLEEK